MLLILSWSNQVYLTDLSTRESTLLCKEEHPVLRLALQGDEWLWVATTDSSLHKWPARERASTKSLQRASSFVAGSLPFARARANIDGSAPVCRAIPVTNHCFARALHFSKMFSEGTLMFLVFAPGINLQNIILNFRFPCTLSLLQLFLVLLALYSMQF
jgi:hypothetical protein